MKITLVVPVFNDETSVLPFYQSVRTLDVLKNDRVDIIFINDGSQDNTEAVIHHLAQQDPLILPLNFAYHFGKKAALTAGMDYATGDAVIPIDMNLQEAVSRIPDMLHQWRASADSILVKNKAHSVVTRLRRKAASVLKQLYQQINPPETAKSMTDFSLLSEKTAGLLGPYPDGVQLADEPIKTDAISAVKSSSKGVSDGACYAGFWSGGRRFFNCLTVRPLQRWTYLGFLFALIAFCYGVWMMSAILFNDSELQNTPSLLISVLFLGGIQLLGIGILGSCIERARSGVHPHS